MPLVIAPADALSTAPALVDATRTVLAKHLGVRWDEQHGGLYRESTSLQGDWLGALIQPAVLLHSTIAIRMELRLDGKSRSWEYIYLGVLEGGTLAGYWHSKTLTSFRGFFCFTRTEMLTDAARAALESKVQTRSPRKTLVRALTTTAPPLGAILAGIAFASHAFPVWVAALPLAVVPLFGFALMMSKRRLRTYIDRWVALLGTPEGR